MPEFSFRPHARLTACNIVVIRGERLVLDDVGFDLDDGEALLLTGPNGAGKSTLLRTLAGLRRLDGGKIRWREDEAPVSSSRLAYLGHQDALKPGLTVAENLTLTARLNATDLDTALAQVDLLPLAELPARLLSAGQKRRAAIARVLLADAALWLLDEPSLGLDAAAVEKLGGLLATHRARGGMVIATTHVPLPLPAPRHLALRAPDMVPER
ncbi:heme exporter ATP-binding protein A [Neoasaia chiangmaiensis NBRC 101099]|uniref:Heme ABC exporter ATP-binding protein CcmA n=1 Tax=Neoasaia chiangmaiensis TaxID=320497 RepID=A0A1U9KT95_9PROT|nr:heme ABC exporter ATP-binding protein CcmA [Neoasaia chiangmaiensis]AQS88962.1 heme ABC exporter ATP-binding protein CcmA [Neoasaia chiangmaiensis]GBR40279.1 heme exporter ATP-binding protein A [Neoasaia chiangmaiensis NBRC 101099]GEN13978.1 cytochrome c biogenesis ATP-binding export protein CcmA [Neoasaia chiangmaiensis]